MEFGKEVYSKHKITEETLFEKYEAQYKKKLEEIKALENAKEQEEEDILTRQLSQNISAADATLKRKYIKCIKHNIAE